MILQQTWMACRPRRRPESAHGKSAFIVAIKYLTHRTYWSNFFQPSVWTCRKPDSTSIITNWVKPISRKSQGHEVRWHKQNRQSKIIWSCCFRAIYLRNYIGNDKIWRQQTPLTAGYYRQPPARSSYLIPYTCPMPAFHYSHSPLCRYLPQHLIMDQLVSPLPSE